MTLTALALTAAAVVAMPVVAVVGLRLPSVTFEGMNGPGQSVPGVALGLTLLAFAAGWGYVLAGAAQGPGLLWVLVAAECLFFTIQLGFAIRLPYPHLIALLLPVVVGALTPGVRRWGQYLLIVLVSSLIVRTTPLAPLLGVGWQVLWLPVGAVIFGLHHILARRPWPAAGRRLLLSTAGLLVYVAVVAALAAPSDLASTLNLSLNGMIGFLSLMWFLLGASFVEGAIALAELTRTGIEALVPEHAFAWVIVAAAIAAAAWSVVTAPAAAAAVRLWTAAALAVFAAALLIKRSRGPIPRTWMAGWCVAAVAAVLAVRTYGTHTLRETVFANAGVFSLAGFIYAITWEVAGEIRKVPLATPRLGRPAPLLLYLGAVVLISTASLFGIGARLQEMYQDHILLSEYGGAVFLSIPLALLVAVRTWRLLPPAALGRCVGAFYLGAILAVPGYLLRSAARETPLVARLAPAPPVAGALADGAILAALAVVTFLLVRRRPDTGDAIAHPRVAAALGCALALGLQVGLAQPVLAGVLQDVLAMVGALTRTMLPRAAAAVLLKWIAHPPWGTHEALLYYGAGPALGIAAALVAARSRREPASSAAEPEGVTRA